MKPNMFGSKDKVVSRREFLRIRRPKSDLILVLDNQKCTGCGLCTIDCSTKALTLSLGGERDTYQILFRQEICDACGACEKSCPEGCLRMMDQEPQQKTRGKDAKVIFDDKISKCMECGIPLFPQAMVKRLESKLFLAKEYTWPFHLCPSCRMKSQLTLHPCLPQAGIPSPSRGGEGEGEKVRA